MFRDTPIPVIDLGRLLDAGQGTNAPTSSSCAPPNRTVCGACGWMNCASIPEIAVSQILAVGELAIPRGPAILDRAVRPMKPEDPVLFIINLQH